MVCSLAILMFAFLTACTPVRTTTKVGYETAKIATKTAWGVGKLGTKVATAPLRVGSGRKSS